MNMSEDIQLSIDTVLQQAQQAFEQYKQLKPTDRAALLEAIATQLENSRASLVPLAMAESHLPEARLNGELSRTTGQLLLFARLIREGSWVEAAIDTADPNRVPAKPDTRKMLVPAGPVVVFGASNFPFAFSTAGGDTASALAAGCSVVIKAHPAHAQTSAAVFAAMEKAVAQTGAPAHTVQHVTNTSNAAGEALVKHPLTTGVGFTGSFAGGRALCAYAAQREVPIPVFAEMSSINPVVFLPDTLEQNSAALAKTYAASITLGMGQFCTNPGLLLGIQSEALSRFSVQLGEAISKIAPQPMLHEGIHAAYEKGLRHMLAQQGVTLVAQAEQQPAQGEGFPTVATVPAAVFLQNTALSEEVFGPYSLLVVCQDKAELKQVLQALKGQLTSTVMATDADLEAHRDVIELQTRLAGRIILNNVPTGVEVCASMVHGGPYPATTDARFTSVGTTAIKRWVRPVCFQDFTDAILPDELKNANPGNIWRLVNNEWTNNKI
jgi:NADP-dependent aldehyde dehydrogenase